MNVTQSILILLLITFSSCQKKPMNDIDFETKNYKLYFLRVNEDSNRLKENAFIRQHSNFYIDDIKILNKIKNNFIKDESEMKTNFKSDYDLYLFDDNNNQIFSGKIDLNNGLLYNSERYYDFSSEITILPEISFKPIEKFRIDINSIKNGKKLVKLIEDNNGFSTINVLNNIIGTPYNGMTILKAKKDYLETREINQKVIEKVKNDLKGLGKVKVAVSFCNAQDYCKFHVYSEKLNSDTIPREYDIIKPLSDSIVNMPLIVYNISMDKLKKIMEKNNIEMNVTQQK